MAKRLIMDNKITMQTNLWKLKINICFGIGTQFAIALEMRNFSIFYYYNILYRTYSTEYVCVISCRRRCRCPTTKHIIKMRRCTLLTVDNITQMFMCLLVITHMSLVLLMRY